MEEIYLIRIVKINFYLREVWIKGIFFELNAANKNSNPLYISKATVFIFDIYYDCY